MAKATRLAREMRMILILDNVFSVGWEAISMGGCGLSAAAIEQEAGFRGVALAGDVPFVRSAVSMLSLEKESNLLPRGLLGGGLARFLCAGQSELGYQVPRWGLSIAVLHDGSVRHCLGVCDWARGCVIRGVAD